MSLKLEMSKNGAENVKSDASGSTNTGFSALK
jgi:hypothetical protein